MTTVGTIAWNKAIEAAAKVCDKLARTAKYPMKGSLQMAAREIRALKRPEE